MCGIEILVSEGEGNLGVAQEWQVTNKMDEVLIKRGPNYQSFQQFFEVDTENGRKQKAFVGASVLQMRGPLTQQPIVNNKSEESDIISGDFLSWNGEIFSGSINVSENENDTKLLFNELIKRVENDTEVSTDHSIPELLSSIHGPFAFIFWEEKKKRLWFGRDPLGRRSLLIHRKQENKNAENQVSFAISSGISKEIQKQYYGETITDWAEIPPDNIYSIQFPVQLVPAYHISEELLIQDNIEDFNQLIIDSLFYQVTSYPWHFPFAHKIDEFTFSVDLNDKTNWRQTQQKESNDDHVNPENSEEKPKGRRNRGKNQKKTVENTNLEKKEKFFKVAAMYLPYGCRSPALLTSGDAHTSQEFEEAVDNFLLHLKESVRRRIKDIPEPLPSTLGFQRSGESKIAVLFSGGIDSLLIAAVASLFYPPDLPIDLLNVAFGDWPYNVPDRQTGLEGLQELRKFHPHRVWNFVEINVPLSLLKDNQEELLALVFPRVTVMDMTIGPALWFGGNGVGIIQVGEDRNDKNSFIPYHSTAKLLLLGNGADEQMCGYGRHRNSFKHRGPEGLQLEINKDLSRLWIRNLGRDDRLLSSLSKESRYPFLDFDFIRFLNQTPLGLICDMTLPPGEGDKRILRCAAKKLGLEKSSKEQKRAIQFGCRISHLTERKLGGHIPFTGFTNK